MTTDSEGNEIGKLFIGGLSQATDNSSLAAYFSLYGEVEDAVVMMDSKTGRSRGFGYVKYTDPKSVELALQIKPHYIDGKEVDAKQCNVNMKGRNRRSLKIFVGGIGLDQDVETLTKFFTQFGEVTDVNLMTDAAKQRHRGFAFIGFSDEAVVKKLIGMHFVTMNNKQVELKAMEPPNFTRRYNIPPNSSNHIDGWQTLSSINEGISHRGQPGVGQLEAICNNEVTTPSFYYPVYNFPAQLWSPSFPLMPSNILGHPQQMSHVGAVMYDTGSPSLQLNQVSNETYLEHLYPPACVNYKIPNETPQQAPVAYSQMITSNNNKLDKTSCCKYQPESTVLQNFSATPEDSTSQKTGPHVGQPVYPMLHMFPQSAFPWPVSPWFGPLVHYAPTQLPTQSVGYPHAAYLPFPACHSRSAFAFTPACHQPQIVANADVTPPEDNSDQKSISDLQLIHKDASVDHVGSGLNSQRLVYCGYLPTDPLLSTVAVPITDGDQLAGNVTNRATKLDQQLYTNVSCDVNCEIGSDSQINREQSQLSEHPIQTGKTIGNSLSVKSDCVGNTNEGRTRYKKAWNTAIGSKVVCFTGGASGDSSGLGTTSNSQYSPPSPSVVKPRSIKGRTPSYVASAVLDPIEARSNVAPTAKHPQSASSKRLQSNRFDQVKVSAECRNEIDHKESISNSTSHFNQQLCHRFALTSTAAGASGDYQRVTD